MVKTAKTNRTVFFAICARLIRQDVKLDAVLRAIRKAIPDANNQSPQAVLEHVRDTLAAAQAKQI